MPPTIDAFLRSWPLDPWLLTLLGLSAFVYVRGWLTLRSRDATRWTATKLLAFLGGLAALFLALASPIETFSSLLLQVHMVQHLLLMMVAPPLLWLGAPLFPLLRGLPKPIRSIWIGPVYRWRPLRAVLGFLTHPVLAGSLFIATTWLWHVPALYQLALNSVGWHYVQHLCFLATGLLFWYPVVRPFPARPKWSLGLLVPCLLLADISNTVLSALLTFSGQVLYPYYAALPSVAGSPLDDQATAGLIMWVPGSVVFLLPLAIIGVGLLFGQEDKVTRRQGDRVTRLRLELPMVAARKPRGVFDLLRVPWLGDFLRWRYARWVLQLPLLLLAGVVIWDGLYGPQVGAMNLAGVLPWIHWRGILIFGLLILGNVFCMACPFMVPRTIARWVWQPSLAWPRWLRSKWPAVALLALFLWAYEAFALWDSPWLTAWIALAYFVGALLVDASFKGASFCKYVCPIGQFNFVQSLVSPLEVKVADHGVCATCQTKDCIKGRDGIPGCELHLYQPRKVGNLDCTFCLDCIHACPHDNVGILAVTPTADLWHDPLRSGVGRFSRRPDLAALVVLLVFGAFANAASMVRPVIDRLDAWWSNSLLAVTGFYVLALVLLPALLMTMGSGASRWLGRLDATTLQVGTRFAFALVPLGFGMWLTHYSFHFLTSYETIVPVAERFFIDLGVSGLGPPDWVSACCKPVTAGLLHLEFVFLELGLLLSLYSAYRIALRLTTQRALTAFLPWAILQLLLFAAGIWIVLQPMQMRGTM